MQWLSELVYWATIKPRLLKLRALLAGAHIHPTGSRYVCSPPVLDTDIDFLVYHEDKDYISGVLLAAGYRKSDFKDYFGTHEDNDVFDAWRRGRVNLIVTSDLKYAETFHTATYICKQHNLRKKPDRVVVHEVTRGRLDAGYVGWDQQLQSLLASFNGDHGYTIHKMYRAQHGLVLKTGGS